MTPAAAHLELGATMLRAIVNDYFYVRVIFMDCRWVFARFLSIMWSGGGSQFTRVLMR